MNNFFIDTINGKTAGAPHIIAGYGYTPEYITRLPAEARFSAICEIFKTFNKSTENGYRVAYYAKLN